MTSFNTTEGSAYPLRACTRRLVECDFSFGGGGEWADGDLESGHARTAFGLEVGAKLVEGGHGGGEVDDRTPDGFRQAHEAEEGAMSMSLFGFGDDVLRREGERRGCHCDGFWAGPVLLWGLRGSREGRSQRDVGGAPAGRLVGEDEGKCIGELPAVKIY